MKVKFTKQAQEEIVRYSLHTLPAYEAEVNRHYDQAERRKRRFGYWIEKDIPTKNMLKALRMIPSLNTPEDWARLHATEALMRLK